MDLKNNLVVMCFVLASLFQGNVYANCPALAGHYLCQGDTGEFQLEIQQTVDSSSTVTYRIRERAMECQTLADYDETFQVDLNQPSDSIFRANCQVNSLFVPLLLPVTEMVNGSSAFSIDPQTGIIVHSKMDREHSVRSWTCAPIVSMSQSVAPEPEPEQIEVLAELERSQLKRTLSELNTQQEVQVEPQIAVEEENRPKKRRNAESQLPKRFFCNYEGCDVGCLSEYSLNVHRRVHTGEKPYHCQIPGCDKKYSQVGDYNRHQNWHRGKAQFFCKRPGCSKGFLKKSEWQRHREFDHSGQ
jgi:hypothetical protein